MRLLVVPLLCSLILAGCIAGDESDPKPPALPPMPDGVTAFRVAGLEVNATEPTANTEIGTPWWKTTGFRGAEPTMAITASGALFAAAGSAGIRSLDGGETWEEVIRIGAPDPVPSNSVYRSWDPLMWYDKWTDIVYFDPMFPPLACTELSWTDDDGETWNRQPPACHPPPMDHQKLFSGPPGPGTNPVAGVNHPTVLYQCYNQIAATQCGVSYDGGTTWPITSPVADRARHDCGGTNGHGVVSEDGVAVVPVSSCDELGLGFSHDSGLTWTFMKIPGGLGVESFDADVVFDENGTLYVLFRGDDHITYLAHTPDLGATWAGPFRVTPPHVKSTFFHTMNHGSDGRLAMAYLGTETWDGDPNDAPEDTVWSLYFATTEDRLADEPEFLSYRVTNESSPVHVGLICTGGVSCTTGRDLLEFIDSAVAPDGTFHVIYSDSCNDECEAEEKITVESKDGSRVHLARLDGWTMRDAAPATIAVDVDASLLP